MTTSESPQIMKACPDESQDQIPCLSAGRPFALPWGEWQMAGGPTLDRESIFELKDGDLSFASVYFQQGIAHI